MDISIVFSGLVGAGIGATTAVFIGWRKAVGDTRDALRVLLIRQKIFKVYQIDKGRPDFQKIFHDSYADIMSAMFAYRRRLFCTQKIDCAWEYYRCGGNPEKLSSNKYFHSDVESDEEFQKRLDRMLEAID